MDTQTKPKAVIFGGSGFIGTHLTDLLFKNGFEVLVADLIPPNSNLPIYKFCDVRLPITFKLTETPDLVFNLAAVHRTPGHAVSEYYETNIAGAINVSNWCNQVNVENLIFTSSIAVYGPSNEIKNEDSILQPIDAYGKSKYLAENIFRIWQAELPLKRTLVICRPAVIFGAGEAGNFTRLAKALKYRFFVFPGDPSIIKACGYVKDMVRSLLFCTERTRNGVFLYNFCFPKSYSIMQICESFHQAAHYPMPLQIPLDSMGKILSKFPGPSQKLGRRLLKLTNSTHVESARLAKMGFHWEYQFLEALQDWQAESPSGNEFK